MTKDHINPQIGKPSPLDGLVVRAIRQYGDFAIDTVDGDLMLMFIDFANQIVEDIRLHPYWNPEDRLDYYEHQTDVRDIPDVVVIAGLKAYYAEQQASDKVQMYLPKYFKTMNQVLYQRRYGNGRKNMYPIESSQSVPYHIPERE